MAGSESDQPRKPEEFSGGQIVERNSQRLITRIRDNNRDTRYVYDGGKMVEKVQTLGMGSIDLGFVTSYFYQPTGTGREMIMEVTGTKVDRDKTPVPAAGFEYAAIWIPIQSSEARLEFAHLEDGRVDSKPVVLDAYRREYELMRGPVVDLETGEDFLAEGEAAIVFSGNGSTSHFDAVGTESVLPTLPHLRKDSPADAFIKKHFPKRIPWS